MGERMPIMLSRELRDIFSEARVKVTAPVYFSVPMELLRPHEQQAQRNHYQTLARLAERGGLSPCEAVAILEDRPWRRMSSQDAYVALARHVEEARRG